MFKVKDDLCLFYHFLLFGLRRKNKFKRKLCGHCSAAEFGLQIGEVTR